MALQKTIMAVGAHPDDIEIGCGGTIRKHILNGDKVYYVIATNGEMGGNPEKRIEEAKKAANIMGTISIDFLNLKDTFVSHDGYTVHLLDKVIKKTKPHIIYVHSLNDLHQDHRNLAHSTLSASRKMKNNILCYEAPSTTLEFNPTVFSNITNTFELKIQCLKQFESQEKKDYLEREALVNLSKFRGKIVGVEHAEAFEVIRIIDW
ncbi:PIG-L deacetylase family protein [Methanomethylovorans sp.]|uniref:PIG-L deacetylase family protein n=1 Tax=Methanomethylovorans sp. TaxID=2758717 RepID=UPI00345E93F1